MAHSAPHDRGERATVVVVDDDADLRRLARTLLEASGRYTVVAEVGDGIQGVEAVGVHHPDVVVLDALMPRMDGFSALPTMLRKSPHSMVVMWTVLNDPAVEERAEQQGAFAYLRKGDGLARLPEVLDELLSSYRRGLDGLTVVASRRLRSVI